MYDVFSRLFVHIGAFSMVVGALLFVFDSYLTGKIRSSLDGTPGIPFRRTVVRKARPSGLILAAVMAWCISAIFLVQAFRGVVSGPRPIPDSWESRGTIISIAGIILGIVYLVLVVLSFCFRRRLWRVSGRENTERPNSVVRPLVLVSLCVVAAMLSIAMGAAGLIRP